MKPPRTPAPHVSAPGNHYVHGAGSQTDAAAGVTSYLFAGPLCFGGIGYGLDRWLGTHAFVAVGVLIGMALSLYVIWLRYGTDAGTSSGHDSPRPSHHDTGSTRPDTDPATDTTTQESQ